MIKLRLVFAEETRQFGMQWWDLFWTFCMAAWLLPRCRAVHFTQIKKFSSSSLALSVLFWLTDTDGKKTLPSLDKLVMFTQNHHSGKKQRGEKLCQGSGGKHEVCIVRMQEWCQRETWGFSTEALILRSGAPYNRPLDQLLTPRSQLIPPPHHLTQRDVSSSNQRCSNTVDGLFHSKLHK